MKRQSILTPKSAIGDPEPSAAGMVERVARVLCRRDSLIDPGAPWIDEHWPKYAADARAAIAAMREPSEAMLRASPVVGTGPDENGDWKVNTKPAQIVWPAMIDAALAEDTA